MSVLDLVTLSAGTRALVLVDSECGCVAQGRARALFSKVTGLAAGARFEVSKLLVVPHLGIVIASRGSPSLLNAVFMHCALVPLKKLLPSD